MKITTAQTLAIDSLERKITNLSKRHPIEQSTEAYDIVVKQDEKLRALVEKVEETPKATTAIIKEDEIDSSENSEEESKNNQEVHFKDMFPDIQEDELPSSDEDDERDKYKRLERLGAVSAPAIKERQQQDELDK